MISRRSILQLAGAAVAANLVRPVAAEGRLDEFPDVFDIIDASVWIGSGDPPARHSLPSGTFLSPDHEAFANGNAPVIALLSPANARLLAEFLRFEPGWHVADRAGVPALAGTVRPDAHLVVAHVEA